MPVDFKRMLFGICAMALGACAQAATLRVPAQYPTIQAAIQAAQNGDTVLVADGTYHEQLWFDYEKVVTVQSEHGARRTIIDGDDARTCAVFMWHANSVLDGFTIRRGRNDSGVGGGGGGVVIDWSTSPTIRNNIFDSNNSDGNGGAISASYGYGSAPVIVNNLFTRNSSVYGGGAVFLWCDQGAVFRNNTFASNLDMGHIGDALYFASTVQNGSLAVENCIFWDNGPNPIYASDPAICLVSYSDVQGGRAGAGNIDSNPLFRNPQGGDYHLGSFSPCADAASGTAAPGHDLDGQPRYDDRSVQNTGAGTPDYADMGAYERQSDSVFDLEGVVPNYGFCEGGALVRIVGEGFAPDTVVMFDGVRAEASFVNNRLLLAVTPPHAAGAVDVTASGPHGADTMAGAFTYYSRNGGKYLLLTLADGGPGANGCKNEQGLLGQ